jgi:DNA gyrase/topoisomerase IV subunit A
MDDEDLIAREDMVVTVSHAGYIKRVPLATYRAQRRGGKGRSGMATRDEDFVTRLFVANTHTPVLFFSSRGIVYKDEGLAPADRHAAVARQGLRSTCCRLRKRASGSPRSCRCPRTRTAGPIST